MKTQKIIVIGGTGLIGSKVVQNLAEHGHAVVAAAPSTGVNAVTGEGLREALGGASVVVDVANSPSFEDRAAMNFFRLSTSNLLEAEAAAGVGHHVALSVVGTDRLAPDSGYFRAKLAQEDLIAAGPIPYTIVRATQFFEFLRSIADTATVEDTVRVPPSPIQPIASADVAEAVAMAAASTPVNGISEIGGPERFAIDEVLRTALTARGDHRTVVTDPDATYWGVDVSDGRLLPAEGAALFDIRLADWILETAAKP